MSSDNPELIPKNSALTPTERPNEIFEMATSNLRSLIGEGEFERTAELSLKYATARPQQLRICTTDCPMRDMCPWVVGQDPKNHPDTLGLRCPIEAQYWEVQYSAYVEYIRSKDTDHQSEPTLIEKGLCKEAAYTAILEHRALIELSRNPNQVIDAIVPGTDGMTAEQENPRVAVWERIRTRLDKSLDRLNKIVDTRLKERREDQKHYIDTLAKVNKDIEDHPERYAGTKLANFLTSMKKRVEENQIKRAERYGTGDENQGD